MSPVKSRRDEYSQATRQALVDAATTAFAERGYTRASLDDIAAMARVTKGALYHHFAGKQALFEAVLDTREQQAHEKFVAAAAAHPDDAWAGTTAALAAFLDACCDQVYGYLCFVEGPAGLGWHRWREFEDKYAYGLTEAMLRGLIDAGVIEPVPLEAATHVAVGMLSHAGIALAETAPERQPQVKADLFATMTTLLAGLRRPTDGRPVALAGSGRQRRSRRRG